MGIQVQGQQAPELPPGSYTGVCQSIEEDEGDYGKYLRAVFDIEHEGNTVQRSSIFSINEDARSGNLVFTPKSDLGKLLRRCGLPVEAICNGEESFDLQQTLEGQSFTFTVVEDEDTDLTTIVKDTIRLVEEDEQTRITDVEDEEDE